jgi:hypothetical protein
MLAGAAAGQAQSIPLLALGAVLAGGGQGIAFRGTLAMVSPLAPASARADVTSAFYAAIYTATGSVAVAIGFVATAATLAAAIPGFAAGISVLTLVMAVAVARTPSPVARGT